MSHEPGMQVSAPDAKDPPIGAGRGWMRTRRWLRGVSGTAWFGIVVIVLYAIAGIFAPIIAPYGESQIVGGQYEAWGSPFILGTDQLGRDMLSRLLYGIRNTTGIAVLTTFVSFLIGCAGGISAAVLGGWADQILSRMVDVLMAIPLLVFALVLISILGPSIVNLVLVIAVLDSTRVFRLSRLVALSVTTLDFIEAARLQGEGLVWIVSREILPNIIVPLAAEAGVRFCFVFLTISALSFLGLGLQPPTADLGSMVRENATLITYGDITPLIPAAAIAVLTLAVNFL
ncbi:MAG: ABC transporter permease, partial [Pseudorhodoplanes sp.]